MDWGAGATIAAALLGGAVVSWNAGGGGRWRRSAILSDREILDRLPPESPARESMAQILEEQVARHIALLSTQYARGRTYAELILGIYASAAGHFFVVAMSPSDTENRLLAWILLVTGLGASIFAVVQLRIIDRATAAKREAVLSPLTPVLPPASEGPHEREETPVARAHLGRRTRWIAGFAAYPRWMQLTTHRPAGREGPKESEFATRPKSNRQGEPPKATEQHPAPRDE